MVCHRASALDNKSDFAKAKIHAGNFRDSQSRISEILLPFNNQLRDIICQFFLRTAKGGEQMKN
jgi:hypothetical protein